MARNRYQNKSEDKGNAEKFQAFDKPFGKSLIGKTVIMLDNKPEVVADRETEDEHDYEEEHGIEEIDKIFLSGDGLGPSPQSSR